MALTKKQRHKQRKLVSEQKKQAKVNKSYVVLGISVFLLVMAHSHYNSIQEANDITEKDVRAIDVHSLRISHEREVERKEHSRRFVMNLITSDGVIRAGTKPGFKLPQDKKLFVIKDKWLCAEKALDYDKCTHIETNLN